MTLPFAVFSLSIAFASASIGHIGYYGYHGPPAPLSSDGRVIETPEVAHARAIHLAAYAAAAAKVPATAWVENAGDATSNVEKEEVKDATDESASASASKEEELVVYKGPLAPLDDDGRVVDTPEVAQAKAAHLAAHAAALAKVPSAPYDEAAAVALWDEADANRVVLVPSHVGYTIHHKSLLYRGPSAPLAPDGRVLDTKEVAEAKAAHLRAYANAATLSASAPSENCQC